MEGESGPPLLSSEPCPDKIPRAARRELTCGQPGLWCCCFHHLDLRQTWSSLSFGATGEVIVLADKLLEAHFGSDTATKKTPVAGSFPELMELQVECDGQHTDLTWGRTAHGFATPEEVKYPLQLCRAWAAIISRAVYKGKSPPRSILPSNPDKKARVLPNKHTKKSSAFVRDWSQLPQHASSRRRRQASSHHFV